MSPAFCKDKCQLAEDAAIIKQQQQKTHDATLRMEVKQDAFLDKFDEYMRLNDAQHETFFNRTRWAVTWKGAGMALGGIISAGVGIVAILKYFVGG